MKYRKMTFMRTWKAPKHDIKIMMGNFNVKDGKELGLAPNVG